MIRMEKRDKFSVKTVKGFFLLALLLVAACATTQEDPTKVSWFDLMQGDRLETVLENKRQSLASLKGQRQGLEASLKKSQASLERYQAEVSAAKLKNDQDQWALDILNQEISTLKVKQDSLSEKLLHLKSSEASLKMRLDQKRNPDNTFLEYEKNVKQLNNDIAIVESMLQKIKVKRARYQLSAE